MDHGTTLNVSIIISSHLNNEGPVTVSKAEILKRFGLRTPLHS